MKNNKEIKKEFDELTNEQLEKVLGGASFDKPLVTATGETINIQASDRIGLNAIGESVVVTNFSDTSGEKIDLKSGLKAQADQADKKTK